MESRIPDLRTQIRESILLPLDHQRLDAFIAKLVSTDEVIDALSIAEELKSASVYNTIRDSHSYLSNAITKARYKYADSSSAFDFDSLPAAYEMLRYKLNTRLNVLRHKENESLQLVRDEMQRVTADCPKDTVLDIKTGPAALPKEESLTDKERLLKLEKLVEAMYIEQGKSKLQFNMQIDVLRAENESLTQRVTIAEAQAAQATALSKPKDDKPSAESPGKSKQGLLGVFARSRPPKAVSRAVQMSKLPAPGSGHDPTS